LAGALPNLAVVVGCLALGAFVLWNQRSRAAGVFGLLGLVIAFTSCLGLQPAWGQADLLWPLTMPLVLHLALELNDGRRQAWHWPRWVAVYGPAGVLFAVSVGTLLTTGRPLPHPGAAAASWGTPVALAFHAFLGIAALAVCLLQFKAADRLGSVLLTVGVGLITLTPLSVKALALEPAVTPLGCLAASCFLAVATHRVRMQDVTPESAVRDILATMADAVLLTDTEARVVSVNWTACDLLDRDDLSDLIGRRIDELFAPAPGSPPIMGLLDRGIRDLGVVPRPPASDPPAPTEHQVHVSLSASTLRPGKQGPTRGYVFVARDITERKLAEREKSELEAQLAQSQRLEAIGTLAGGIAHDFNNLLTAILADAAFLKSVVTSDTDEYDCASNITLAAQRAAVLTAQLLGFARKGKLREDCVDVHDVVSNVVSIVGRTFDKQIRILEKLDASPSTVQGDPAQIEQVLMNMAINARDAMPRGGELTFETRVERLDGVYCESAELPPGQYITIIVRDTGSGVPGEIRDRLFEPFFTTKEQGKGTGMGLAMAYGIVKNHGGCIRLLDSASEQAAAAEGDGGKDTCAVPSRLSHDDTLPNIGAGAAFEIRLPVVDRQPAPQEPASAPVVGTGRILVVDDEDTVRATLSRMLRQLGYDVALASNGVEAVELFRREGGRFDLVILDMIMPEMNGADCFRELKTIKPGVKVLVATGHASRSSIRDLEREGVLGVLHKPFEAVRLSSKVSQVMHMRGKMVSEYGDVFGEQA
jgi:PAS domain S-box-containing protein